MLVDIFRNNTAINLVYTVHRKLDTFVLYSSSLCKSRWINKRDLGQMYSIDSCLLMGRVMLLLSQFMRLLCLSQKVNNPFKNKFMCKCCAKDHKDVFELYTGSTFKISVLTKIPSRLSVPKFKSKGLKSAFNRCFSITTPTMWNHLNSSPLHFNSKF